MPSPKILVTIWFLVVAALGLPRVFGRPPGPQATSVTGPQTGRPQPPGNAGLLDKLPHPSAYRRLGTSAFQSGDGILSLAYSPNGAILASGGRNDGVRLLNAQTGQLLRQIPENWVWALAFSADGNLLATAGANKVIRLWDVETGAEVKKFAGHQATVKALAFSSDGAALVSGGDDNTVRLWKLADGSEVSVYRGHSFGVNAVAISPNMRHLASCSTDRTVRVWEYADKPVVFNAPAAVMAIAYLPDRKTLITGCDDGFVRVWEIATAKQLRQWKGHEGGITHLSLSQDGAILATNGLDKTVRLWNVAQGTPLRSMPRNAGDGDALALSQDGKFVAAAGLNNVIRRWDVATGNSLLDAGAPPGAVTAVGYTADGGLAAAGFSTNQVIVYDLNTGKEKSRLVCGPEDAEVLLAVAPNGQTLATASAPGAITVWDLATGAKIKHLALPDRDEVRSVAYNPDDLKLAVGTAQGGLRIWDVASSNLFKHLPTPRDAKAVAYSRDGKFLAVGSDDVLVLYDTANFQVLRKYAKLNDMVACLAFSPDSRTLAAGMFAGTVQLFDLTIPKEKTDVTPRALEGHRGVINSLAWSPNGRCLVTGGFDKTVRIWEFVNAAPIFTWPGHAGEVAAVAFHPSGRTLISGSRDTTLLLWDVTGFGNAGQLPQPKQLDVPALENLWKDLASENNVAGNEAIWKVVTAKDNVNYLAKKVFLADPKKIKQCIDDLNSDTFKVRETAFATLASYERWIEGILRKTLDYPPSEEVRQRVSLLLQRLSAKDSITLQQERLRARRVIEVLEQTNTPPARDLLRELAAGAAEEDLREMAQAALDRISKR